VCAMMEKYLVFLIERILVGLLIYHIALAFLVPIRWNCLMYLLVLGSWIAISVGAGLVLRARYCRVASLLEQSLIFQERSVREGGSCFLVSRVVGVMFGLVRNERLLMA